MSYFCPQVPVCSMLCLPKTPSDSSRLLPAECNNVRCLVFAGYPPQKIDRDVVDSGARRPR